MASVLKMVGKTPNIPFETFEVDDVADMLALDVSSCMMGSRCYVINTGEVYALNSAKQWKLVPQGGGGDTPSPSPSPSDTYIYDGGTITI